MSEERWPTSKISLNSQKRVLFLTKDLRLIQRQLYEGLNLRMEDLTIDDLLDDINTDVMTPAWVCFDYDPAKIAENAYAGLLHEGRRVFESRALIDGGFEVIVSGHRKGTGSSRETAPQCEKWSGIKIVIAASFAPIHERNNINLGQLMGDHDILKRLQNGESIDLHEFTEKYDPVTKLILEKGGIFPFAKELKSNKIKLPEVNKIPHPMTIAEKIISNKLISKDKGRGYLKPGDAVLASVDGGYSHEFTTAQVHEFLKIEYGDNYSIPNPPKFAVFEDHLLYATGVPRFGKFKDKIQTLRDLQNTFQKHTGVRDYSAVNGVSPGICHQVAREEFIDVGDFIQATDSHTCMGGASNALTYGVGSTEYANLIHNQFAFVKVPESIRFNLVGRLDPGCTAKDVILHILWKYAANSETLDRSMEFGGPGLSSLSMDERATLCNMATECSAKTGICDPDDLTIEWLMKRRQGLTREEIYNSFVFADKDAKYDGGIHDINLDDIQPMVAHPGDPDKGIPSDPTNGAYIKDLGVVNIDIAYAGSCTAGKDDDFAYYAKVTKAALDAGLKVADGVECYIQFGSKTVKDLSEKNGWTDMFEKAGIKLIDPGCGACIGAGPGVSDNDEQVSISAINRNFQGRSGPGKLYLASPLTVMASAFTGQITAWDPELFS
ncbi:TPA: aconitate hydratase [Candidatus Thalassarchaeaceae archaeon]|nr:aconitate hydratase [Euryarchaeota archaeon]MDG1547487.1 aconitase family protein [Candidatus Thalassarchaeaceae archaeon]DAC62360.1 MAG TPA: aconitate hydratase [Candidatus Poseidoniales archaeon]MBT3846540.1 aconitate hydratase [Euryarchaeota archaeon]MBT4156378.1 aconitate hydratase [Euryarchaeota archaeon]